MEAQIHLFSSGLPYMAHMAWPMASASLELTSLAGAITYDHDVQKNYLKGITEI